MATLHMDVEAARTVHTNITNTHTTVTNEVSIMTNQVQGLIGVLWMGNSASEFLGEYENWRTSTTQLLDALNTMATRLQNEITEWETMAQNLSA